MKSSPGTSVWAAGAYAFLLQLSSGPVLSRDAWHTMRVIDWTLLSPVESFLDCMICARYTTARTSLPSALHDTIDGIPHIQREFHFFS